MDDSKNNDPYHKPQDELLHINMNDMAEVEEALPCVDVLPLFADTENGVWVIYAKFKADITLPRHYHTGTVHFYTTKGSWWYLEYPDDVQTSGSYLYEPGGSIHALRTGPDGAEGFIVMPGANVNVDDHGNLININDATYLVNVISDLCKERGIEEPRYIRATSSAAFSRS